jgi:hypothetical protein
MKTMKFKSARLNGLSITQAFRQYMFMAQIAANPEIRKLEMTVRSMNLQRQP